MINMTISSSATSRGHTASSAGGRPVTLLWCDLDGEFLTPSGHARVRCTECAEWAVVRKGAAHHCLLHAPDVTAPEWFTLLRESWNDD